MNKNPAMTEAQSDNQVICSCFDFSIGEMRTMLSENPDMTYDVFLEKSGAGARCTACLLDLEYFFVNLPREEAGAGSKKDAKSTDGARVPLRQRVYKLLDRLSPRKPIALKTHVPVIVGPGIEQWLWLANYPLLYSKDGGVPDFDISMTLYNSDGQQIWRNKFVLKVGDEMREELTQHVDAAAVDGSKELSIFWLDVTRRAKWAGVRGTTRPQIQIVTSKSCCAVHGQAAGFIRGSSFDLVYCPNDDRTFVSLLNTSDEPVKLNLEYPIDPLSELDIPVRSIPVELPPRGVMLHEIEFLDEEKKAFDGRLYRFAWVGTGRYKAHVLVASKSLDRFSIDHA